MPGLEFVDGLMDATQPVCQAIQLIEPLLLVKEVLLAWVGIRGWIDGCYTALCQVPAPACSGGGLSALAMVVVQKFILKRANGIYALSRVLDAW